MAFPSAYADSDADDEYERSILTSPVIPGDEEGSHSESEHSTEHTPTTFDTPNGDKASPKTIIPEWTADECAKFLSGLNLSQYCNPFIENEIDGEALIALGHEELKEMGIASAGHRLTILKGVYDIKIKQDIPIEIDDYVPPSAETNLNNRKATQDDISRIIRSMRIRDEQMLIYEAEIKRLSEDYRKLRDELLPVFRMTKERQPLPSPYPPNSPEMFNHDINNASPILAPPPAGKSAAGVSRKGSQKRTLWPNPTPKNASPTYPPSSIPEGKIVSESHSLNPSNAAVTASQHLTASATGGIPSPNAANLPSPTSPNNNHYPNHQATASRMYSDDRNGQRTGRSFINDDPYPLATPSIVENPFRPTQTPGNRSRTNTGREFDDASSITGSSAPSVEIFKSFRVSVEDPCYKVLPAALKKYNIQADWRQYALYIVYGDQERCLGLDEKPLILFKQLDKEGKKPMFMLRRHAPPTEGHSGPSGLMSADGGLSHRSQSSFPLPGGVL